LIKRQAGRGDLIRDIVQDGVVVVEVVDVLPGDILLTEDLVDMIISMVITQRSIGTSGEQLLMECPKILLPMDIHILIVATVGKHEAACITTRLHILVVLATTIVNTTAMVAHMGDTTSTTIFIPMMHHKILLLLS